MPGFADPAFLLNGPVALTREHEPLKKRHACHTLGVYIQAMAVAASIVYSGVASFVLLKIVGSVLPLRADANEESVGMDLSQHGEEAYVHAGGSAAAV